MACPPLRLAVPSDVLPSLNVTVPLLSNAPPGLTVLTVAVNVTLWPNTDAAVDELTVVHVLAMLTVCSTLSLLPLKFVSPL